MKRIILALLLSVCLMMAFALPVFAQEPPGHSGFGKDVANLAKVTQGASVPTYVQSVVPLGH